MLAGTKITCYVILSNKSQTSDNTLNTNKKFKFLIKIELKNGRLIFGSETGKMTKNNCKRMVEDKESKKLKKTRNGIVMVRLKINFHGRLDRIVCFTFCVLCISQSHTSPLTS